MANEPQLINAGNERAHEADVDEGDEQGVGFRSVVCEECADGPDGAKDADYEEDQDVVRRERVVGCVDVDEEG
jgi:hypothetical protein